MDYSLAYHAVTDPSRPRMFVRNCKGDSGLQLRFGAAAYGTVWESIRNGIVARKSIRGVLTHESHFMYVLVLEQLVDTG